MTCHTCKNKIKCLHCDKFFSSKEEFISHANDITIEVNRKLHVLLDYIKINETEEVPKKGFLDIVLNQIIENKKLSSKILFKDEKR